MSTPDLQKFAARLKTRKETLRLTLREIADAAGVTTSAVAAWTRGENFPNREVERNVADVLQSDVDWLLGKTDAESDQGRHILREKRLPFGAAAKLPWGNDVDLAEAESLAGRCGLSLEQFVVECVRRFGPACRDAVNKRRAELSSESGPALSPDEGASEAGKVVATKHVR